MSNVINDFKQKFKGITDFVSKASSSVEKEKIGVLKRQHDLAIKALEKEKDEKLKGIKTEHDKRLTLLSSNKDKINEYEEYVNAAESVYNKKVNELNSIYEKDLNYENEKYSKEKEQLEKELVLNKTNLSRKKFEELKEKELESLFKKLDNLNNNYAKEKEEFEEKYKEETKKVEGNFSKDGIDKLECMYIPEEDREKIARYVLSGYIPVALLDDKEILIGDEIGKRKLSEEKTSEETEREFNLKKINEEIDEAIKQIKALKFEDIDLDETKENYEKGNKGRFDSQER